MSKQDKRQQIVAAALKVMADKGYEKASIKDIAGEAGITPGLVHYYFSSKEEILSSLLMEASKEYTQNMHMLRANVPVEHVSAAAMAEPKQRVSTNPEWYRLRYELFALGLRNSTLAPGVGALLENGRDGIARILQDVFEGTTEEDGSLAAILLACFDGLALQKLVDPTFDLEEVYTTLERVIRSYAKQKS